MTAYKLLKNNQQVVSGVLVENRGACEQCVWSPGVVLSCCSDRVPHCLLFSCPCAALCRSSAEQLLFPGGAREVRSAPTYWLVVLSHAACLSGFDPASPCLLLLPHPVSC